MLQNTGRLCGDRKTLDRAAKTVGVNFLGGFSALVSKNMTKSDRMLIEAIPRTLAETERVCSSVNVGSTKNRIKYGCSETDGEKIVETALLTSDKDLIGLRQACCFLQCTG